MQNHRRLVLRLTRGALERASASVLITPANDSLVGNEQPMYWRFINRRSADGAVRLAAGAELQRACLAIEPLPEDAVRHSHTPTANNPSAVEFAYGDVG